MKCVCGGGGGGGGGGRQGVCVCGGGGGGLGINFQKNKVHQSCSVNRSFFHF